MPTGICGQQAAAQYLDYDGTLSTALFSCGARQLLIHWNAHPETQQSWVWVQSAAGTAAQVHSYLQP